MSWKIKSNNVIFNNFNPTVNITNNYHEGEGKGKESVDVVNNSIISQKNSKYHSITNTKIKEPNSKTGKIKDFLSNAKNYFQNNHDNSNPLFVESKSKDEKLIEDNSFQLFPEKKVVVENRTNKEAEEQILILQNLFYDFHKLFENIKNYNDIINNYRGDIQIKEISENVNILITELPKNITKIKISIGNLETLEPKITEMKIKFKITEFKKNLNNKILPKKDELSVMVKNIFEKEKEIEIIKAKKLKYMDKNYNEDTIADLHFKSTRESMSEEDVKKEFQSFNQLAIKEDKELSDARKDINFGTAVLNIREKELNEIGKISAQIKEMSSYISMKVTNQGELLNRIEDNVLISVKNASSADDEIEQASNIVIRKRPKIIFLLCFVLTAIIFVICAVYFGLVK